MSCAISTLVTARLNLYSSIIFIKHKHRCDRLLWIYSNGGLGLNAEDRNSGHPEIQRPSAATRFSFLHITAAPDVCSSSNTGIFCLVDECFFPSASVVSRNPGVSNSVSPSRKTAELRS